jgi:protein-S-isoprenylcysteine O-methyltransferase Ste14
VGSIGPHAAFGLGSLAVRTPAGRVVGVILFLSGLGLAVWARIYLGRNWGVPMTKNNEPELVTSGPYRFVRPLPTVFRSWRYDTDEYR